MNEIVSREEQYESGMIERRPNNFVSVPQAQRIDQFRPHETRLDVVHPATQHVELRTSAVDRAQGFQLMITPVSIVVAVLAVLVSLAFDSELLSFASILIFWITFALIYVGGWILTALVTPEAVSWYGAKRQWDVIDREQKERWNHYKWQSGRAIEAKRPPHRPVGRALRSTMELPGWALFLGGLAGVVVAVLYLVGV